ncbi:MAG: malonic semialdehyde reductase [Alphaproteobacteria bacterium]|nr:malonic semialdehyde reductase [Alphaproteobacteria bacterium]
MLDDQALDLIFRTARTNHGWTDRPIPAGLLERLYDLAKWAPTSMNCSPARIVFVVSPEAKAKLKPALSPGNVDKTMAAPATAIVGMDLDFHKHLPRLFPAMPKAQEMFASNAALAEATAFRNSALQGAYLIVAARALGLDCGPMSGFDAAKVEAAFFSDGRTKANFLINLGHGDPAKVHPRGPRFAFAEACRIA